MFRQSQAKLSQERASETCGPYDKLYSPGQAKRPGPKLPTRPTIPTLQDHMFTPKFGKLILKRKRSADDVKNKKVF